MHRTASARPKRASQTRFAPNVLVTTASAPAWTSRRCRSTTVSGRSRFQRHGSSFPRFIPIAIRRVPIAASSSRAPLAMASRKRSVTGLGPVAVLDADAEQEAVFLVGERVPALAVELLEDLVH